MCCLFEPLKNLGGGQLGWPRDGGVLSTLKVGLFYFGMRELSSRRALYLLKSLMSPILVRVLLGISKPHSWHQIGDGNIGDKANIGTCFQKQLKAKEVKRVKISSERWWLQEAATTHRAGGPKGRRWYSHSTLTAHCSCPVRQGEGAQAKFCSAALKPMTSACHQPSPTSSIGATSTDNPYLPETTPGAETGAVTFNSTF